MARKPTMNSQSGVGADSFASPLGYVYAGVGAADLQAAALQDLPRTLKPHPLGAYTLSPSGQKCYWVFRAALGSFDVWLNDFLVSIIRRTAEVNGETCAVLETVDLLDSEGDGARFEVRATP